MGIQVSLQSKRHQEINPDLFARHPRGLIEEIEDYKRQAERLARIYDLHRSLGLTLDLDAMIEAFSRWLAPQIGHELVAYRHFGRKRTPTACSCHGPFRNTLQQAALKLMEHSVQKMRVGAVEGTHLHYHLWPLDGDNKGCLLLIHAEPRIPTLSHGRMVEEILQELRGPLERALAYEDLYDQARRDALTGLVNRRVFEERVGQELANAERYNHPLVLASLDLDHFKAINDSLGHGAGDKVLRRVSRTFSNIIRDSDLLARVGGDEFALILPNTGLESAQMLMNRLCDAVRKLDIRAPGSEPLGVSIGLAAWEKGTSFKSWWNQSDTALYRAKASGRSRVSV